MWRASVSRNLVSVLWKDKEEDWRKEGGGRVRVSILDYW